MGVFNKLPLPGKLNNDSLFHKAIQKRLTEIAKVEEEKILELLKRNFPEYSNVDFETNGTLKAKTIMGTLQSRGYGIRISETPLSDRVVRCASLWHGRNIVDSEVISHIITKFSEWSQKGN